MNTEIKFAHECAPEDAPKFWEWIKTRGGVAVWKSANLSNPGASWSTPADVQQKPTWQADGSPVIHTNPDTIGVYQSALFKAFPVALKQRGMSLVITDAAQRKVDKYMAQCKEKHGDAFYQKGVLDIDGASIGIYYTTEIVSLSEYIHKNHPELV